MTPKEEAGRLYLGFSVYEWSNENGTTLNEETTKKHATLCVNEILDNIVDEDGWNIDYWNDVKTEIENL